MKSFKSLSNLKSDKRKRALCLTLTLFVVFVVVTIWGNFTLCVESFEFESQKLESVNGIKIAHISDYHNTKIKSLNKAVITSLNEQKPDAIFITGDLFDSRKTDISKSISFVSQIIKIAPVYYVTGNHECNVSIADQSAFDNFIDDLKAMGVVVLREDVTTINLSDNQKINVYGIFDPLFYCNNSTEFTKTTEQLCSSFVMDYTELNLLLAHQPEQINTYADFGFDIVYSGHAHGGQGRLFGVGLIAPDQGLFPKYSSGLYYAENTILVVSRGIGNSIAPVRVFCRPHLIYTTIK